MKSFSLLTKLLFVVSGIFGLLMILMFSIGTARLSSVIDHAKQAEYAEKLGAITRLLASQEKRLPQPGMEETSLKDVQATALKSLQATFPFSAEDPTTAYLIDQQGRLLLPARNASELLSASLVNQLLTIREEKQAAQFNSTDQKGQKAWCMYQNFAPWGWTVFYRLPYRVKYAALTEFSRTFLPLVAVFGAGFLLVLYLLIKKQLKPVRELIRASSAMATGNYQRELPPPAHDEIGLLTRSFAKMRQTVHEQLDARQASEKKFRALLDNQRDAIFLHKLLPDGYATFSEVNAAAVTRYDYSRAEFKDMTVLDITAPEEVENYLRSMSQKALLSHQQATFESVHRTKSDKLFPVEISSSIMDLDGEPYILATVRDISARKTAEDALSLNNEIFQKLTNAAKDAIIQLNHLGKVEFWNRGATDLFGYEQSEIIGADLHQLLAPKSAFEKHKQHFPEFLKTGRGNAVDKTIELEAFHKDGSLLTVELSLSAFELNGKMQSMAVVRDITERKKIEAQISRFNRVVEQSLNEIYMFEIETLKFVDVNLGARNNLGYTLDELKQLTSVDIKPEMTLEQFNQKVVPLLDGREEQIVFTTVHQRKDGSLYPVEVHLQLLPGQPPLFMAIILDITKRKEEEKIRLELERELRQKYKMEAVGVLAGGMAHNFNNNLAIILGNLELAQLKSSEPKEVRKHLDLSKTALLRSRDLIKQILLYSRQEEHERAPIKAVQIVEETLKLLHSTIPTTVTLQYSVSPSAQDVSIVADETQIQEALINLSNNAVHAMGEKGELTISLDTLTLKQSEASTQLGALSGDYLQISVRDTGSGIPEENLEKIFDPFFTTKGVDEGTGMGLSTVRGIVEQHDGFIKVQSVPSKGTVFELYFPVMPKEQHQSSDQDETILTGSETILFVDDDEMLANMGQVMLSEMGYRVTSMTSPLAALKRIDDDPQEFDLVVTDQTMPDLTGKEFAQQVKKIRADLPLILCTGYSSQISAADAEECGICRFCMKPLSMRELSRAVRECLN